MQGEEEEQSMHANLMPARATQVLASGVPLHLVPPSFPPLFPLSVKEARPPAKYQVRSNQTTRKPTRAGQGGFRIGRGQAKGRGEAELPARSTGLKLAGASFLADPACGQWPNG